MKNKSIKSWIRENWELCRRIVKLRDKDRCGLCRSKENLQVDHAFTRATRALFYEIRNLTLLCGKCHFKKSKRKKGHYDLKVYDHVAAREGAYQFEQMKAIDNALGPFPEWQYKSWHEAQNFKLKDAFAVMMGGK